MQNKSSTRAQNWGVIILAAGQGKRMKSHLPKILHAIGGQSMISHILDRISETDPSAPIALVVGHGREQVEEEVRRGYRHLDISFVHQAEQKGTGHAARCAMESEWGKRMIQNKSDILVLPGDSPLMPKSLIEQMVAPLGKSDAMRLLTTELVDPTGYGRVVRRGKAGPVLRITEERDANTREKQIREVAASTYLFRSSFLGVALQKLSNKNAQGEYYLTDLIAQASRAKKKVDVLTWLRPEDLKGVNDLWELAEAGAILNQRCLKSWSALGVKFIDPKTTWVDVSVRFEADAVVYPGAILRGRTQVGAGVTIGPHCVIENVEIGAGAQLKAGTVAENSRIEEGATLGPYAHLRPDSHVGKKAKIGNFVELKKSRIGEGTSVAHLSYLGDAEVGKNSNIGCGFVTCNFDGRIIEGERKHRTIIEDDVFVGSDCQAVAPVRIGRGAYIASGSTINEDVESEALAIARSRQVNKPGYARKIKGENKGA